MNATLSPDGKKITIELDVDQQPSLSSSGKTFSVAGTGGFLKTNLKYANSDPKFVALNGQAITISVNCNVKPAQ